MKKYGYFSALLEEDEDKKVSNVCEICGKKLSKTGECFYNCDKWIHDELWNKRKEIEKQKEKEREIEEKERKRREDLHKKLTFYVKHIKSGNKKVIFIFTVKAGEIENRRTIKYHAKTLKQQELDLILFQQSLGLRGVYTMDELKQAQQLIKRNIPVQTEERFDYEFYLRNNPDLRKVFKFKEDRNEHLWKHWLYNGVKEKRKFRFKTVYTIEEGIKHKPSSLILR